MYPKVMIIIIKTDLILGTDTVISSLPLDTNAGRFKSIKSVLTIVWLNWILSGCTKLNLLVSAIG